jgi:hypothetical protein
MSDPDDRRPHRLLVLSMVVVVVVGVGVLSAVLSVPAEPTTATEPLAAFTVAPTGAGTSSSFCAAGTGTAAGTTVFLTNTRPRTAHGVMTTTVAGASGSVSHEQPVDVPPGRTMAVDPGAGLPGGSIASTLAFTGGGVAVDQEVSGASGWSMAPCASTVATQWYFPSGSTAGGNSLTLSLFNPTASPVLADVTFLTANGLLTPQPFQGIVVGPAQLVDEDVGSYAQSLTEVATVVSVVSGALVADEFQQWGGPSTSLSLELGSIQPSGVWRFAGSTPASGSTVGFDVGNPSSSSVTVTFSAKLPSATVVPHTVEVAGFSTASFSPSSTPGWPNGSPVAVTVRADGPVVVGQSVIAATGTPPPGQGLSLGTSSAASEWLVPAPWAAGAPATSVATSIRSLSVANAGDSPCRVTISALGRPRPAINVVIAPGQLADLARQQIPTGSPYLVTATSPVIVDADLVPSAPGVVTQPVFPISG